jgi:hypothetical protein
LPRESGGIFTCGERSAPEPAGKALPLNQKGKLLPRESGGMARLLSSGPSDVGLLFLFPPEPAKGSVTGVLLRAV